MSILLKTIIKTKFFFTSKEKAKKEALDCLDKYLLLCKGITEEHGKKNVLVPTMEGVDEDMRNWSLYMLLEHHTKVNKSISAMAYQLSINEEPHGEALIDPKKDVMPSENPGHEQIERFEDSIRKHVELMDELPSLRGTKKVNHPIFGSFNAHMWNCLLSFHLKVHYEQAKFIKEEACK